MGMLHHGIVIILAISIAIILAISIVISIAIVVLILTWITRVHISGYFARLPLPLLLPRSGRGSYILAHDYIGRRQWPQSIHELRGFMS